MSRKQDDTATLVVPMPTTAELNAPRTKTVLLIYHRDGGQMVRLDAEKRLSPGQIYEVRKTLPYNFGKSFGVAWYTNPNIQDRGLYDVDVPDVVSEAGYFLLGVYRA